MNTGFNVATCQSDEWETPAWVFDGLHSEYGFTLDGAARSEPVTIEREDKPAIVLTEPNNKLARFSTAEAELPWAGERVFCNPPYSNIEYFVRRAWDAELCVLLLPVRTDSNWHRLLTERGAELRYWRKRIAFLEAGKPMGSPRFASLVAIVRG